MFGITFLNVVELLGYVIHTSDGAYVSEELNADMVSSTRLASVYVVNDHKSNRVLLKIVFFIQNRSIDLDIFIWPEYSFKSLTPPRKRVKNVILFRFYFV